MTKSIITGVEKRKIADLMPYHGNPKLGDIDAIAESMAVNGIFNVLGIDPKTNEVLYGSHRLHALHQEGVDEAWCVLLDVRDDNHAKKINAADNRTSDLGKYDDSLLAGLLQSLPDLSGTGYDDKALSKIMARLDEGDTSSKLEAMEFKLIVECRDEQQQAELLTRLEGEGLKVKALMS